MTLKLITLDLDDTLWPVEPVLAEAEQHFHRFLREREPELFNRIGIDELRAHRLTQLERQPELRHDISRWRHESLYFLLCEQGLDQARAKALANDAFAVFLEARQQVTLFEGADAALSELADEYRLIALTNGNADVNRMAVGKYFSAAIRAEELGVSKPAPAIFERALALADCTPDQALHIGDDPYYDIEPAQALGMHSLQAAICGKHPPGEPSFQHWREVPTAVAALSQRLGK